MSHCCVESSGNFGEEIIIPRFCYLHILAFSWTFIYLFYQVYCSCMCRYGISKNSQYDKIRKDKALLIPQQDNVCITTAPDRERERESTEQPRV